jgi:dTDP-glucose 4,6-dehydratase
VLRNLLNLINDRIIIRADKPLFFQVSTDEVYGDIHKGLLMNQHLLTLLTLTQLQKQRLIYLVQSWARTYGLEYIIARPSNNYGPHQYPEKLIPLACKRLGRGKKIKLT